MKFKEYILSETGFDVSHFSPEELREFREEHKRWYNISYQRIYRKNFKRIELRLSGEEVLKLQKAANIYDINLAAFIKTACLSYLDSLIYLPPFSSLEETKSQLLKANYEIYSLVNAVYLKSSIDRSDLATLSTEVASMHEMVNKLYSAPKIIVSPLTLSDDN